MMPGDISVEIPIITRFANVQMYIILQLKGHEAY